MPGPGVHCVMLFMDNHGKVSSECQTDTCTQIEEEPISYSATP
jgi:hypothetical protein